MKEIGITKKDDGFYELEIILNDWELSMNIRLSPNEFEQLLQKIYKYTAGHKLYNNKEINKELSDLARL